MNAGEGSPSARAAGHRFDDCRGSWADISTLSTPRRVMCVSCRNVRPMRPDEAESGILCDEEFDPLPTPDDEVSSGVKKLCIGISIAILAAVVAILVKALA